MNVYEGLNPQDRRERFGGVGYLESTSKTCGRCGETKPVSAFYRHRRTKDGLRWSCKTYEAEYRRTYYRKHTEMERLYVSRRTRRKGTQGHNALAERRRLCQAYGHKCLYCGASGVPLTGVHVILPSLDGSDSVANPQALMRYLQQHVRRHDCQLPRRLGGG